MRLATLIAVGTGLLTLVGAITSWACEGTSRPPCGQTVYISHTVDRNVVHVAPTDPLFVAVEVHPLVLWNPNPNLCAQPSGASADIDIELVPLNLTAAAPVSVSASTQFVPTPTAPGQQEDRTFSVMVPAGMLSTSIPYVGTATINYHVDFSGGTGAGRLSSTAIATVCVVPAAPTDPVRAEIDIFRADPTPLDISTARRGDQHASFIAIANNSEVLTATLDLDVTSIQRAQFPAGNDNDFVAFALSSPISDTDAFLLGFADTAGPSGLLVEFDPMQKDDRKVTRQLVIPPGGVEMVGVLARSHGMCATGSCSQTSIEMTGTWSDGRELLGCVSMSHIVGDDPPSDPLYEVEDELKVGANQFASFDPATFNGDAHSTTHGAGNSFQEVPTDPGFTQLIGAGQPNSGGFPSLVTDTLRTLTATTSLTYTANVDDSTNQLFGFNRVTIVGPPTSGSVAVPGVTPAGRNAFGDFDILIDIPNDLVQILEIPFQGSPFVQHSGTYSALSTFTGNQGIAVHHGTCRTFRFTEPGPRAWVDARTLAGRVPTNEVLTSSHRVYDPETDADVPFQATARDPWVTVRTDPTESFASSAIGDPGELLEIQVDPLGLPQPVISATVATSATSGVEVLPMTGGQALSVEIHARAALPEIEQRQLGWRRAKVALNLIKADRDKFTLTGVLPGAGDIPREGATGSLDIGMLRIDFSLDRGGKFRSEDRKVQVKLKYNRRRDETKFSVKIKKSDLSGMAPSSLADGPTVKKPGFPVVLPAVFGYRGTLAFIADLALNARRKQGKSVKASGRPPKQ